MMDALRQLQEALGPERVLTGAAVSEKHHADSSGEAPCPPLALVRPSSTEEVSRIMQICHEAGQKVALQGGLTGLCGGATPQQDEIALSLERLSGVEEVDRDSMTMTVRAGTPLQTAQEAAATAGLLLPLDLGARGTCTIGGNIATNAGGNEVIRYGMTRNLTLGLEVVLADGAVIAALNKMLKNNAGYDLKHLFIGSEGTLGIVTRATLRLFPRQEGRCAALVALGDFADAVDFLRLMKREFGGSLNAFEALWDGYCNYIVDHAANIRNPFDERHPLYALTETRGGEAEHARFEKILAEALEAGRIRDAVVCKSERERRAIWALREGVAEIPQLVQHNANFDVSLPLNKMDAFLRRLEEEVEAVLPGTPMLAFGHLGDGNLHLIFPLQRQADKKTVYDLVYQQVGVNHGSISAEHGIGMQKRAYLRESRSPEEIALMRLLKQTLDPKGILNPGRVIG